MRSFYILLIILSVFCGASLAQNTVQESATQWWMSTTFEACPYQSGGHVEVPVLGSNWTVAVMMVYKCDENKMIIQFTAYAYWIPNYKFQEAFNGILDMKDTAQNFIIDRPQKDFVKPLLESVSDTFWTHNEMVLKYESGDTSITFKGDLRSHTTSITKDTFHHLIEIVNQFYIKTI